jgi:hypothetical protein
MTSVSPAGLPENFPHISSTEIDFGDIHAGVSADSSFLLTNPGEETFEGAILSHQYFLCELHRASGLFRQPFPVKRYCDRVGADPTSQRPVIETRNYVADDSSIAFLHDSSRRIHACF